VKQPGPRLAVVSPDEADPELEQLFAAARTAVEPEAESRARVTSALAAAGVRPGLGGAGAPGALQGSVTPSAVRASGKWLVASGALTLALGFWLGHGVGRAEGRREVAAVSLARQNVERESAAVLDTGAVVNGGPANEARANATGSNEAGSNEARANAARESSELDAEQSRSELSARERSSRPASPLPARGRRRAAKAPDPVPSATLSFREVLEQLRRARAQLDAGQATMSLLVLSELDRNAGDLLLEERETTRVLALCAAGQDRAARAAADRLRADSPRSIYAMRLESSCVADGASDRTPNGIATDTADGAAATTTDARPVGE
jgi:hypothetical protein